MSDSQNYLQELQETEVDLGLTKIRTLAIEFSVTLDRLTTVKKEFEAFLEPKIGVDYESIAAKIEPQISRAADLLLDIDMLSEGDRNLPGISEFLDKAIQSVSLRSVDSILNRLSSLLVSAKEEQRKLDQEERERIAKIEAEEKEKFEFEKRNQLIELKRLEESEHQAIEADRVWQGKMEAQKKEKEVEALRIAKMQKEKEEKEQAEILAKAASEVKAKEKQKILEADRDYRKKRLYEMGFEENGNLIIDRHQNIILQPKASFILQEEERLMQEIDYYNQVLGGFEGYDDWRAIEKREFENLFLAFGRNQEILRYNLSRLTSGLFACSEKTESGLVVTRFLDVFSLNFRVTINKNDESLSRRANRVNVVLVRKL